MNALDTGVWLQIASYRLVGPLLPNLVMLSWKSRSPDDLLAVPLFIHDNTISMRLSFDICQSDVEPILATLRALFVRPLNLKRFEFYPNVELPLLGTLLVHCFSIWKQLEYVSLPKGYATDPILVKPLGRLPGLKVISLESTL